jgi:hypothetical protein
MKEGRSSDSVEYISDESEDDVEEHGDQDKLSNFNSNKFHLAVQNLMSIP